MHYFSSKTLYTNFTVIAPAKKEWECNTRKRAWMKRKLYLLYTKQTFKNSNPPLPPSFFCFYILHPTFRNNRPFEITELLSGIEIKWSEQRFAIFIFCFLFHPLFIRKWISYLFFPPFNSLSLFYTLVILKWQLDDCGNFPHESSFCSRVLNFLWLGRYCLELFKSSSSLPCIFLPFQMKFLEKFS